MSNELDFDIGDRPPLQFPNPHAREPEPFDVPLLRGRGADPTKPPPRPDAYEVAHALAGIWESVAFCAGPRGWFHRPIDGALWHHDNAGAITERLGSHGAMQSARRGTTRRAVLDELSAMLWRDPSTLDQDDWTVGVPSADGHGEVLDLRTGRVRRLLTDEIVTRSLAVAPLYGTPTLFLRTLRDTIGPIDDAEQCEQYIRWWARRALTGDCSAEAALFLHGPPGTGKSTIADTLGAIFGSYGSAVAADQVTGDAHQHRAWLARLAGARFVRVAEMPKGGGAWRTADLLALISGETMTANHMHSEHFDFRSTAHLLMTGNDVPNAGGSSGVWRRLRILSCRQRPDVPDEGLKSALAAEVPMILHWLVEADDAPGRPSPPVPESMLLATEAERDEANPTDTWLRESLVVDRYGVLPGTEIYSRYRQDMTDPLGERQFNRVLSATVGAPVQRKINGVNIRVRKCRWGG